MKGTLRVRALEDGLPTKAAALAVEALQAARAISEKPRVARGGPWSMPSALGREALVEIRRVANCRSLLAVAAIAGERPQGALAAHLGNLRFTAPRGAVAGKPVVRGAVVTTAKKPGRSGTAGNKCRRSQVVGLQVLEASRILQPVPVSCAVRCNAWRARRCGAQRGVTRHYSNVTQGVTATLQGVTATRQGVTATVKGFAATLQGVTAMLQGVTATLGRRSDVAERTGGVTGRHSDVTGFTVVYE